MNGFGGCQCAWKLPLFWRTAGWGQAWQGKVFVPVNTRVQGSGTDSAIRSSSLTLCKQLCVACVHTCLGKNEKDWRAKALSTWFEFHHSREKGGKCWLTTLAAGLRELFTQESLQPKWREGQLSISCYRSTFPWSQKNARAVRQRTCILIMSVIHKTPFVYSERF